MCSCTQVCYVDSVNNERFVAEAVLSGRASLLQAWVEGTLSLVSRHPMLLQFLQDDGTFTEDSNVETAASVGAGGSPEKEMAGEQVIAEYQCLRRCQIRAEAAMDSEKVGVLDMGATVLVFEEKKLESGAHRVRFDKGWCSLETADGTTVLAKRSSATIAVASAGADASANGEDNDEKEKPATSSGAASSFCYRWDWFAAVCP